MRPRLRFAAVSLLAAFMLAACSSGDQEAAPDAAQHQAADRTPEQTEEPARPEAEDAAAAKSPNVGTVASVLGSQIVPLDTPDGEPVTELSNPTAIGAPLVFLVIGEQDDWLEVQVPIRPNGSTGWIRADEVQLNTLTYALEVSIEDRTVTLLQDGNRINTFNAAIGTGDTPTPTGEYFLTELLRPTNDGYGPYAFGVSAFSDVLNSFGGGPGQIGLHGTPDEDTIGQAVSHGCIRLNNEDITYLAEILPLGTPITIA